MFAKVLGTAFRVQSLPQRLRFTSAPSNHIWPSRFRLIQGVRNLSVTGSLYQKQVTPFLLADIGEGIKECEIVQWFVKAGDKIEQFDKICEVQSDKASVEITSRYDGVVSKIHYSVGDLAQVGKPLIDIETEGADSVATAAEPVNAKEGAHAVAPQPSNSVPSSSATPEKVVKGHGGVLATPAVRRVARESNVNLEHVEGTGKDGRVLKSDVLSFIESSKEAPKLTTFDSVKPAVCSATQPRNEVLPLTAVQKAMFKSMSQALLIPHFGYSEELLMNSVVEMRKQINDYLRAQSTVVKKVTFMPIIVKSFSMALLEFPILNARILNADSKDLKQVQVSMLTQHNVGIAMDTKLGLLVPSIKNVESKSILEIAAELDRLKDLGSRNALSPSELSGGTITLSNIGIIGGTNLKPILVPGQVCIAALGKVQRVPRYEGSSLVPVPHDIMHVSFSADHRIVDGATIARFTQKWKFFLENPLLLSAFTR